MKKLNKIMMCSAAALMLSSTANATNNVIHFYGQVSPETCTVSVNGSPDSSAQNVRNVVLKTAALADFKAAPDDTNTVANRTAQPKEFTISLTGCAAKSSDINYSTFFSPLNASSVTTAGNLANDATTGAATGIELQLLRPDGVTPINFSIGNGNYDEEDLRLQQGSTEASATYTVRYISTGTNGTAGNIMSMMAYAVRYD